jgi:hypothetical protein
LSARRLGSERGRNTSRPTKNSPTETAIRSFMCIHRRYPAMSSRAAGSAHCFADSTQGHGRGRRAKGVNRPRVRQASRTGAKLWATRLCPRSYPQNLSEQFYTDAGKRLAQAAESGRSASAAALRAPEMPGRPLGPAGPVDGCCVCVNGPRVPSTWGPFLDWAT